MMLDGHAQNKSKKPGVCTSGIFARLAFFGAASLLMSGCFMSDRTTNPDPGDSAGSVSLNMRMGVGSVAVLSKGSTITLKKLILVFTSSASDTVRDTITSLTSPALDTVSTSSQTIVKNYTLKALRSWKIVASLRDARDSVIHFDSATVPALYAGNTAAVNLSLTARYSMYAAKFLTIPDSVESATPSQPKQKLTLNRLVLKIDGTIVRDSTRTKFDSLTTHILNFDYVRVYTSNAATSVSIGTSRTLYGVQFPTADTGYIVGDSIVLKSVNGGATWSTQNTGADKILRGLSFLTGTKGVIVGGGVSDTIVIRRTTDGSTWTKTSSVVSSNTMRAVHMVSDTGWAIRSHASSLTGSYQYQVTYDGGVTWFNTVSQEQAYSVRGVNGSCAWAVGPAGKIRKTGSDALFSTVQTSGTTRTLRSVYPVNASLVYVVGDTGTILRTTNGGSAWTSMTSGTTRNLNSVWFLDAATGFAVGDTGTVLRTADSGNTWVAMTSPTTAALNSVSFYGTKGYVVGAGGTFLTITGIRQIEMLAYGPMGTWDVSNPLFKGSRYIFTAQGVNDTLPLTLSWVGPTTGTGAITATIGKVGKIQIIGNLPGTNL